MLKNKLYKISSIQSVPGDPVSISGMKYKISISLDQDHEIFKGHFPGNPVLPGVCQLEIVRELAEEILGCKCMLAGASQVKFLNPVNPMEHSSLAYDLKFLKISDGEFDVNAVLASEMVIFMKMKGRLKEFNSGQKV
jgi:3-hydroxyacyl-[acyl-carrier-protein] dehydratase